MRRLLLAVATLASVQLGTSAPAWALSRLTLLPSSAFALGTSFSQPGCGSQALAASAPSGLGGGSKSQAILGGQLSRLEMIARQQGGDSTASLGAIPAAIAAPVDSANCPQFALPLASPFSAAPGPQFRTTGPDDFLASKRLPVQRTAFDAQWHRVSRGGVSRQALAALGRSGGDLAGVAAINRWTNNRVRFVEDRVQYGRADYWATAQATLQRGAGDCEDIAIAKLQLLAATGVPRSDMYLTIARDLARNADHAMLVVKLGGKFWLLDNATDDLLDASQSLDYRPILSYSDSGKWLHGY